MAKNKGLGRGLSAIFEDNSFEEEKAVGNGVPKISTVLIDVNPHQPRKTFDAEAMQDLKDSIATHGVLQPILVRAVRNRYEIIAGERRFRACLMLGLEEIPAIVLEADDVQAAKYALIENLQREDLNPWEEACGYRALIEEFHLTQAELSLEVGSSRSVIANSLRLLELPDEVAELIISGELSAGHGRTLLGLDDYRTKAIAVAEKCIESGWTVRQLESAVKVENKRSEEEDKIKIVPEVKVDYRRVLEEKFTGLTGRRCQISESRGMKTFKLEYRDDEDLEAILKALAGDKILDE